MCAAEVRFEQPDMRGNFRSIREGRGCKQRMACFSQVGLNPAHCYEKDIKHPQLCQTCCKEPECNFIKPIEQQIKEAEAEVAKNPERKNSAGSASKKISFQNISLI